MGRPAGVVGADTLRAIRKAAIARIYEHGFEAMNLRDLAADVGLRLGSLYNHVPQKQALLGDLLEGILQELLQDLELHMAGLSDPQERLMRFVRFHIEWHTARRQEVFIGNMELRSLTPEQYGRVREMRGRYEAQLRQILSEGKKAGLWSIDDLRVSTLSLMGMLTGISTWYREDGRLSQQRLVRLYQKMVARLLGIAA
jgi:AcrR family transcriptional regulator